MSLKSDDFVKGVSFVEADNRWHYTRLNVQTCIDASVPRLT